MEADFSVLLAAVKIGQVQSASSTAVLARPTGTCLSESRPATRNTRKRGTAKSKGARK